MKRFINENVVFIKSNTPTNIYKPYTSNEILFDNNKKYCPGTEWLNLVIYNNDKMVYGDYCIDFDTMTIIKYTNSLMFKAIFKLRKIVAINNIIYIDLAKITDKNIISIIANFNKNSKPDIVSVQYQCFDTSKLICTNKDNFAYLIVDELQKIVSIDYNELQEKFIYCLSEFAAENGLTDSADKMKIVNDWTRDWYKKNIRKYVEN